MLKKYVKNDSTSTSKLFCTKKRFKKQLTIKKKIKSFRKSARLVIMHGLQPWLNAQFGSKIKIPKNMWKTTPKAHVFLQKNFFKKQLIFEKWHMHECQILLRILIDNLDCFKHTLNLMWTLIAVSRRSCSQVYLSSCQTLSTYFESMKPPIIVRPFDANVRLNKLTHPFQKEFTSVGCLENSDLENSDLRP